MQDTNYEYIRLIFENLLPQGYKGKSSAGEYYLTSTQDKWVMFKQGYKLGFDEGYEIATDNYDQDDGK